MACRTSAPKKIITKQRRKEIKEYFYLQLRLNTAKCPKEAISLAMSHFFVSERTVRSAVGPYNPNRLTETGAG
jgi:hypothetical protein